MEIAQIHQKIYEIRGQKVMLDFDSAELYEVEIQVLVSQIVIPSKSYLGGAKPFAFTEQGVSMLSAVLKSKLAIALSITIIRAFVQYKKLANSNEVFSNKLKELDVKYDKQFDDIFEVINYLLKKDSFEKQTKERGKIGYRNGA